MSSSFHDVNKDNANQYVTVISVDYPVQPIFPPEQYSDYIQHYREDNAQHSNQQSDLSMKTTMKSMSRVYNKVKQQ
ncbi:hypothetical protein WDU94_013794 [Cyamophila willieti]